MRLLILILMMFSCSTLSKNTIQNGDFIIREGKSGNKVWSETLLFSRTSWYRELTLYYEVFLANVQLDDPFANWFSESEKSLVKSCHQFYVAVNYSVNENKISHSSFRDQMASYGLDEISITQFKRNLELHPDFETYKLGFYRIMGYCQKDPNQNLQDGIVLTFPGFSSTRIDRPLSKN